MEESNERTQANEEVLASYSEGLTPDEVRQRAELATYLTSARFPTQRDQLLDIVSRQDAPPQIIDLIDTLPSEKSFGHFESVWESLDRQHS